MLNNLMRTDPNLGCTVARLALGVVIFSHGAQKMLGWFGGRGFTGTVQGFEGMGIPVILTVLIIMGEFFGSLGLIFGLFSRVAAAGIGIIMLGAIFMAHLQHGFFMNWSGNKPGEGFEYHILAIGLSLIVTLRGSGLLSVDAAVSKR